MKLCNIDKTSLAETFLETGSYCHTDAVTACPVLHVFIPLLLIPHPSNPPTRRAGRNGSGLLQSLCFKSSVRSSFFLLHGEKVPKGRMRENRFISPSVCRTLLFILSTGYFPSIVFQRTMHNKSNDEAVQY